MSRDCFSVVRTVTALLTLLTLAVPHSASAEPSSTPRVTNMPVTDGDVHAAVQVGNILYFGGDFRRVGVSSGRFATISASTGVAEAMAERFDTGQANVVIPDGSGGWYVGGQNIIMGPQSLKELIHILPDGSADPAFEGSDISGQVEDLLLHNGLLYLAGNFIEVNGVARRGLAAVDPVTGALDGFDPLLNGGVHALERSASTLYAGGEFTDANGTARAGLAAFDLTTHSLTSWNPGVTGKVLALQLAGTTMYVGGQFTAVGGASRLNLAALDTTIDTNNATPWDPHCTGRVLTFGLAGNMLLVGGEFILLSGVNRFHLAAYNTMTGLLLPWAPNPNHFVRSIVPAAGGTTVYIGGQFEEISGQYHPFAAEVELANGNLTAWNPAPTSWVYSLALDGTRVGVGGLFAGISAQPRFGLAAINLDTNQLTSWTAAVGDGEVSAMAHLNSVIYIGGTFSSVNSEARQRLAALHINGALQGWSPAADGPVYTLAATNTRLFVGGAFANAAGIGATNLIAVDPLSGTPVAPALDTSGEVRTLFMYGGRLFVGGAFDTLAGTARSNVGALLADATVDLSWAPSTNGPVRSVAAYSARIYIGGDFSELNGVPRSHLGVVGLGDAAIDPAFAPVFDGPVYALKVATNSLFVGGDFIHVNGITRPGAVTLELDEGIMRIWSGSIAGGYPTAFVPTNAGMWVLGDFAFVAAKVIPGLAFYPDDPPTLEPLADITVPEDTPVNGVPLVAGDELLHPSRFHFTATSSNPGLVAVQGITFTSVNSAWTMSITPAANVSASTTIAITLHDGLQSVTRSLQFTTTSVNDQPVISGLVDATTLKDSVYTRAFTVADVDNSPNTINLTWSSSNQALVPTAKVDVDGSTANKTVTVTPLAGQTGSTIITITVNDGVSGDVSSSFLLTVVETNTAPTISAIANQATTMGVAVGPLSFIVGDTEGGALTTSASSSNPTLVPLAGLALAGSEGNRTITVTPAAGQTGIATITITVTDTLNMTASTSFQVTVNGVPPGPPQNLQAAVANTLATLTWQAPITGGAPTTYVLEGGTTPGGSDLPTTPVGLVTSYVANLPVGTYFLRVRAANAFGLSAPSNEVTVTIASGLPSVPGAPTGLVSGVSGQFVTLYWMAPATGGQPTHYILEAGSATGQANLATVTLASTATGVQFPGVPFGVYHLRVRAANAHGIGPASNEAVVTVGGVAPCTAAPTAPVGLTPTVQGSLVTLSWAPGSGSAPAGYRIRVGTLPGQIDLGEIPIDSVGTSLMATAPPGTYYVHLIAINACGISAPSNELSLTTQNAQAPPGPVTGLTWFLGPSNTVTLQWQAAPGEVTSYIVVAGSTPGAHDVAVVPTGTTATSLSVDGVGSGTYHVYVRATNGGGHGPASNGIVIVVP